MRISDWSSDVCSSDLSFAHSYVRNMIVPGENAKRALRMESLELQRYRELVDADVDTDALPPIFATAAEIAPHAHVDVLAAAQAWIDSSLSKTLKVPSDIAFDDFKHIYLYAKIGRAARRERVCQYV